MRPASPLPARRSREDVDRLAAVLKDMSATIIRGPEEASWAPGYYSVLFEDPDGIRLEMCFVPGAGLLASGDRPIRLMATTNQEANGMLVR
jgi:hypothetical protein